MTPRSANASSPPLQPTRTCEEWASVGPLLGALVVLLGWSVLSLITGATADTTPGAPMSTLGWGVLGSGNLSLVVLAAGLRSWTMRCRGDARSASDLVLASLLGAVGFLTAIGLVCVGSQAPAAFALCLLVGLPMGSVLFAVWTWMLNRVDSIQGVVLAVGFFVLLIFAVQFLIQHESVQSDAAVLNILSLPLIYVAVLAIAIWGSTPLQTPDSDGR